MNKNAPARLRRLGLSLAGVAAAALCAGCVIPSDVVHRSSVEVPAHPKDLRACVVEATRGIDGVPGVNPPSAVAEQTLVEFRTTVPYVSGEVEQEAGDVVRVSFQVMARVEPDHFWEFAQPRAKAIGDAIVARCGAL